MSRNSEHKLVNDFMSAAEFMRIRRLTGCNRDQFARCFPFTPKKIELYETGKKPISQEDADYMKTIRRQLEPQVFGR